MELNIFIVLLTDELKPPNFINYNQIFKKTVLIDINIKVYQRKKQTLIKIKLKSIYREIFNLVVKLDNLSSLFQ